MKASFKMRPAIGMVELILSIIVIGVILSGTVLSIKEAKENRNMHSEFAFYSQIEKAIKNNFLVILDTFEKHAGDGVDATTDIWGWRAGTMDGTSPFPTYEFTANSEQLIVYDIDRGTLSASEQNNLYGAIRSNLQGICTLFEAPTATQIKLRCNKLRGLDYLVGGAEIPRFHTLGDTINPTEVPTVIVKYTRISSIADLSAIADYTEQEVRFGMNDVYTNRQNYSLNKMNTIRSVIRTYGNSQLLKEIRNPQPSGLNSLDDEFVPWFWGAFGSDQASVLADICGGIGCSSMTANAGRWQTSVTNQGGTIVRLVDNLLEGDRKYIIDGFNNELFLHPIISECAGNDLEACAITIPQSPRDNYINNIMKPPYVSALYIFDFRLKDVVSPEYGRMYIGY